MSTDISTGTVFVAEPSGRWFRQAPAVVDCSLMATVVWNEPDAARVTAWMAGKDLHAPAILVYEMANVARNKVRSGMSVEAARLGLLAFEGHRITLHDCPPDALFDMAQRYALTAYDAAYLCVADALRSPLLTLDERLAEAASRHLNPGN